MDYIFNTFILEKQEYAKIKSEINTNYIKYADKPFPIHISYGIDGKSYWFFFENHGFNNYNIYMKIPR